MRYLILLCWMLSFSTCEDQVRFLKVYPTTCDGSSEFDPYELKNRITYQYFENNIFHIGISFMDNCVLDVKPRIRYFEDTLEVFAYQKRSNEIFLCDCCFGIEASIVGLDKDRMDSLAIILHRQQHLSLQLAQSDSPTEEYNSIDFTIVKGDTLFYNYPDEGDDSFYETKFYENDNPKVASSFENDYGLNYYSYKDSIILDVRYGQYEKHDLEYHTREYGAISYSPLIILSDGRKGYEVFFYFKNRK